RPGPRRPLGPGGHARARAFHRRPLHADKRRRRRHADPPGAAPARPRAPRLARAAVSPHPADAEDNMTNDDTPRATIRLLAVDDHPLLRDGIASVIEG